MAPGFGTPSVALATTPTVIATFLSHILSSRKRKSKSKSSLATGGPGGGPEEQLSYDEGLKIVKRFLEFASRHGVEEVQAFTANRVPTPHWVRKEIVTVPEASIHKAESILTQHLASYGDGKGIPLVGGENWWKIRGKPLEGEWIEMQKDFLNRTRGTASSSSSDVPVVPHKRSHRPLRGGTVDSVKDGSGAQVSGERVLLYIHGGAFFFSSLDTHRYQIQRHARKAGARAFAPAYRLSPQYPFPCGLLDALASYLYLLDPPPGTHEPILATNIILMGDSAGAGMVLSLLIIIREVGLPMPAGASLISPWVDLTHSMPSIGGDDAGDYIPSSGFHYKPSMTWPPPPGDGIDVKMPDGTMRRFDQQVQMYCPNTLLTHPLVSPINQGSLGGLCPLLILGGGAELLRDEIIYIAHKAASPSSHPPSAATLQQYPEQRKMIGTYQPTRVHLQIYEGCCHVTPTLAMTKPAKYMYRAAANFNIWAFTAAGKALEHRLRHPHSHSDLKYRPSRHTTMETPYHSQPSTSTAPSVEYSSEPGSISTAPTSTDSSSLDLTKPVINALAADEANSEQVDKADLESEASSSSDSDREEESRLDPTDSVGQVSVRGVEPGFVRGSHIVAERVSTHGRIRPFEPLSEVGSLQENLKETIGQVRGDGVIKKWLLKRADWDDKYSSALKKYREAKEEDWKLASMNGFLTRDLQGERPPLCSLAGWYDQASARAVGRSVDETSTKSNTAMMMWMRISEKKDKELEDLKTLVNGAKGMGLEGPGAKEGEGTET
ncbi:hypothetical protein P7C73_g4145, partial [Tremellales sp. Uapishka_1]